MPKFATKKSIKMFKNNKKNPLFLQCVCVCVLLMLLCFCCNCCWFFINAGILKFVLGGGGCCGGGVRGAGSRSGGGNASKSALVDVVI